MTTGLRQTISVFEAVSYDNNAFFWGLLKISVQVGEKVETNDKLPLEKLGTLPMRRIIQDSLMQTKPEVCVFIILVDALEFAFN